MKKVLAILTVGACVAMASASILPTVTETFESYNLGGLSGQGSWVTHSAGSTLVNIVADNGPTLPGTKAAQLTEVASSGEDVNLPLGQVMEAGDIWYFGVDVKTSTNSADYFIHFKTSGTYFAPKVDIQASGSGFNFGVIGSTNAYESVERSLDTWYRLVAGYNFDTGALYLWVNPSVGEAATPQVEGLYYATDAMEAIALRQATGTAVITVDNIVCSSTFADVVVPEPASLLLLGLAGLLMRRR